ncbi:MAG: hypothetical protein U0872_04355 [Planctomycetaceae bacterium]
MDAGNIAAVKDLLKSIADQRSAALRHGGGPLDRRDDLRPSSNRIASANP